MNHWKNTTITQTPNTGRNRKTTNNNNAPYFKGN